MCTSEIVEMCLIKMSICSSFDISSSSDVVRLMYLCPTSEDNERQIEEISAQIQRYEETVDSLQRQNDDLSREHAKSVAQVENLQKAIAKIGADIFRHQDLEHKIKREKYILDGLRFHDKQSQVNN